MNRITHRLELNECLVVVPDAGEKAIIKITVNGEAYIDVRLITNGYPILINTQSDGVEQSESALVFKLPVDRIELYPLITTGHIDIDIAEA